MKKYSIKLLFILILLVLCIELFIALIVRNSINIFKFKDIGKMEEVYYYPFEDLIYSNGSYKEVSANFNIVEECNYILKGKSTGVREVLQGAIKTEIEILDQFKGTIEKKYIEIYEPISISNHAFNAIFSFDGYSFLQEDKEYLFCLQGDIEGIYMYTTPMLSKFPVIYNTSDFLVINHDEFFSNEQYYNDYTGYEQLFISNDDFIIYQNVYKELMHLYNADKNT